jgi:hypothetical protein
LIVIPGPAAGRSPESITAVLEKDMRRFFCPIL